MTRDVFGNADDHPDIAAVRNRDEEEKACALAYSYMSSSFQLSTESLRSSGYVAIAANENGPWNLPEFPGNIQRIAAVLASHDIDACYAVPVELLSPRVVFRMAATELGIRGFMYHCSGLNHLLVSEDNAPFMLLCTGLDIHVYAGNEEIIQEAMGMTLIEADKRFDDYVAAETLEDVRSFLIAEAQRYREARPK
jgi:hypothetical protein